MAYDLYPAVDENYNFPPEVRGALATSTELRNTVVPMTQTLRNNLTGAELWDGRLIFNTTSQRINRYDAVSSTWKGIAGDEDVATVDAAVDALDFRVDSLEAHGIYSDASVMPFAAGGAGVYASSYSRIAAVGKMVHVVAHLGISASAGAGRVYFMGLPTPRLKVGASQIIVPGAVFAKVGGGTAQHYALEYQTTDNLWFLYGSAGEVTASLTAGVDYLMISAHYEIP